jgi:hypothetical protein
MSLHASEIGGTQMAPELAYDLLRRDDEETRAILDNVVFLMVPCFNPDGQHMVTDWYNQTLGTDHEGSTMPWLYHKYCGHDNNRDAFYLNLPESAYLAKLMFREWYPQAYQDHHHMGSYGARLYVAPYCDPIHPNGDPLIWREHAWYGAHMAYKLEEAGKAGILNAAQYAGWAHMGFHWLTIYHNIAGMLTESASARLATPLYIHPGQLEGAHGRTMPAYAAQTNFPHPWPGGWWRLRDIVEQQKISAWALLDIAAKFKETVLHNAYQKAIRQTERGAAGEVRSYIIPSEQHDSLTARKLIKILLDQGITVKATPAPVKIAGTMEPPTRPVSRLPFVLLTCVIMLNGFVSWGISAIIIQLLKSMGVDDFWALWIGSLLGVLQAFARVLDFFGGARWDGLATGLVAGIVLPLSFLSLIVFGPTDWSIAVFILLYGTATGAMAVARATMPLVFYDREAFARVSSQIALPANLAGAAAPPALAAILTSMGSNAVLLLALSFTLIALGALLALVRTRRAMQV